jgi:Ca2+-binding EF-hand superfamily protein
MHKLFLPLLVICLFLSAASLAAQDDEGAALRKQLFEKYDKNGDGKLSQEELEAANEARYFQTSSRQDREMREQSISRLDRDGDGEVSEAERSAAVQTRLRRLTQGVTAADAEFAKQMNAADAETILRRARLLSLFDRNKDGKFSDTELAAARAEMIRLSQAAENMKTLMSRDRARLFRKVSKFDHDRDGEFSFAELEAANAFLDEGHRRLAQDNAELRKGLDKDGDGRITREEREASDATQRRHGELLRKAFLNHYDKNGDGQVDPEEQKAWKADVKKLIEDLTRQYDADRNRVLSIKEIDRAIEDGAAQSKALVRFQGPFEREKCYMIWEWQFLEED